MSPRCNRATFGLSVFNFHEVTNRPSPFIRISGLNVEPTLFRKQVKWIKNNYHVISAEELISAHLSDNKKYALITFDDGWRGTFDNALPILEELGLPSTVFLNMGAVGGSAPLASAKLMYQEADISFRIAMKLHGFESPAHLTIGPGAHSLLPQPEGLDEYRILEWQGQIADLDILKKWDACPFVSYGSHSLAHWNASAMSEEELRQDYRENARKLETFQSYLPIFAFPNGQWHTCFSHREVDLLRSEGVLRLFGAGGSSNCDPNAFVLDRISVLSYHAKLADLHFAASRNVLLRKPTLNDLMREV